MADDKKAKDVMVSDSKATKEDVVAMDTAETSAHPEAADSQQPTDTTQEHHKHVLLLVLGVLLMVFIVVMAFAAGRNSAQHDMSHITVRSFGGDMQVSPNGMQYRTYGNGGAMPMGGGFGADGEQTSTTRVSGVVTAVDGDTLTVSGNGTTTKVTVSSNTSYTGSNEPAKVNDSIVAFGAKDSSGTLVASQVRLSRQ